MFVVKDSFPTRSREWKDMVCGISLAVFWLGMGTWSQLAQAEGNEFYFMAGHGSIFASFFCSLEVSHLRPIERKLGYGCS